MRTTQIQVDPQIEVLNINELHEVSGGCPIGAFVIGIGVGVALGSAAIGIGRAIASNAE